MKRFADQFSGQNLGGLVPDVLLPAVMAFQVVRYRAVRVSAARADRDRGALSIELAMLVIVLVVAASLVVLGIKTLVDKKAAQIGTSDTSGE